MSRLIDPRTITTQTIADACDACVALWIKWMAEPEDWMREHLEKRNVKEWVASAARNAWVMHDNCDANMVIIEALAGIGLHAGNPDDIPDDDGELAYNDAIWWAVAHQSGEPSLPDLSDYLMERLAMTPHEVERFVQVLYEAPRDGLERACQRALANLDGPMDAEKVSGVSDQESMMVQLLDMPRDQFKRLVGEARKRLGIEQQEPSAGERS